MAQLLELRDLGIAYTGRGGRITIVVDELDLGLRDGRMHCIAGRAGSGKTSILRAAAGLLQPSSGSVSWNGEELATLGDDAVTARRATHIGYVDQQGSLLEGLSAIENVLVPAVPRGSARELLVRGTELLAELGVADLADTRAAELSQGERKRVALARALLLEPALLILDEPTSGLDRSSADEVLDYMKSLRRRGTALLVASHDQQVVDAADVRTSLA